MRGPLGVKGASGVSGENWFWKNSRQSYVCRACNCKVRWSGGAGSCFCTEPVVEDIEDKPLELREPRQIALGLHEPCQAALELYG